MTMQRITTDDPLAMSADLLSENVERLNALFPEAFTEGKIDFAVLKDLLGGHIDERAGKEIKEENPLFHGDTGFRVFKLDTGNLKPWNPAPEALT
jgi:hypothetical protein